MPPESAVLAWCTHCQTAVGHLPEGWACPQCGSTRRLVSIEALEDEQFLAVFGEREQSLVLAAPLMFGAVLLGQHVPDGRIVETVSPAWFELVRRLKADPNFAYQISPEVWEEMIAAAYKRAGYDEVILTPRSGDLGRDVVAVKRGLGTVRIVNQMKRYAASRVVTADEVRSLYGVMHLDGANKAVLTTTARFAPRVQNDRLLRKVIPVELELIDRDSLFPSLERLASGAV
jgi:restriction system protein